MPAECSVCNQPKTVYCIRRSFVKHYFRAPNISFRALDCTRNAPNLPVSPCIVGSPQPQNPSIASLVRGTAGKVIKGAVRHPDDLIRDFSVTAG